MVPYQLKFQRIINAMLLANKKKLEDKEYWGKLNGKSNFKYKGS